MRSRFVGVLVLAQAIPGCGGSARYSADATGGPSVVVPAHFGEREDPRKAKPAASGETAAPDGGALPEPRGTTPDPPPLVSGAQWLYRFVYKKGDVIVASVEKREFERPVATERRVGRFAVELWVGQELVERVRFDFPLLAADPAPEGRKQSLRGTPAFGPGAETSREVAVPVSDRATRAVLVDRLNGHTIPLPWPPDAKVPAESRSPSP
jgi:hypothetical protein